MNLMDFMEKYKISTRTEHGIFERIEVLLGAARQIDRCALLQAKTNRDAEREIRQAVALIVGYLTEAVLNMEIDLATVPK